MLKTIIAVLIALLVYKYANFVITVLGLFLGIAVIIAVILTGLVLIVKIDDWIEGTAFGKWLYTGDGKDRSFKITRGR